MKCMASAEWWALPRCPDCCRRWRCIPLNGREGWCRRPHRRRMLVDALMPRMIVNDRSSEVRRRGEEGGSVGGATV